jgi:membrane associated rhomboid family serine protease
VSALATERRAGGLRGRRSREGLMLLAGIVALMWAVEIVNSLDANALDADGIYPRNLGRLWGVLTAPFLHASFNHLIDNTVPFVCMGAIIALRGAARLAAVTAIIALVGGIGTWLVAPSNTVTVGASGVVFGYATYLLTRGAFDHSPLELLTGAVVGVLWGGVLLASVVPQPHISWQGHVCGAVGGLVAAWWLAGRPAHRREPPPTPAPRAPGEPPTSR